MSIVVRAPQKDDFYRIDVLRFELGGAAHGVFRHGGIGSRRDRGQCFLPDSGI